MYDGNMTSELIELLKPYYSLSIIGMAKNAGKTTVLNSIIEGYAKSGVALGLTSIGRDGESVDVVTKTGKPEIYVGKGTLIATAAELLALCDITKEIVAATGINTPMGEVVVVRARSEGYVQLGGPSINSQVARVCGIFAELGADKAIVDGAISRKTMASPSITDATVLCTGAALGTDMREVIRETAHTVRMFTLAELNDEKAADAADGAGARVIAVYEDYSSEPLVLDGVPPKKGIAYIFLSGAVSDRLAQKLIMSNISFKNAAVVVPDASKLFIGEETYEKLLRLGVRVLVRERVNLAAVTVNPVSPYGHVFDEREFVEGMREKVGVPVYNVLQECRPPAASGG